MRLVVSRHGVAEPEVHDVDPESRVGDLAGLLDIEEDVEVFVVDQDEPLDSGCTLLELELIEHAEILITQRRDVDAIVEFNLTTKDKRFPPQTRMSRIYT